MAQKEITFGLVHGSWHGAWCWKLLQDELAAMNYKSVAIDLPIDDPDADFDDYADVVAKSLEDETNSVLVGHSRAGNVIPRAAAKLATKGLIFLCSSFEPETIRHPVIAEKDLMPPRNNSRFDEGIIRLGSGLTRLDPHIAKELFYHDCPPDVQSWAAEQLRVQRRFRPEPILQAWPNIPQHYIMCRDDRVVNPEWSRYAAQEWLGIEPIEISGGHSPFLSRPRETAELLVALSANLLL